MIKKYSAILLAILLVFVFAACAEEPVVEEPPVREVAEAPPVGEESRPEQEDEAEEEEELLLGLTPGIRELSSNEAVSLAWDAFNRVLDYIFPEPGAVDVDLVIGFETSVMGMVINYEIEGSWKAIIDLDSEGVQWAVVWDMGELEGGVVEIFISEDEKGNFFARFASEDELIELDADLFLGFDEDVELFFDAVDLYVDAFVVIELLFDGDFGAAEIEDKEDGTTHYTIALCEFGAEDLIYGSQYKTNVLQGFVESFIATSGIEVFPEAQESLIVIVMGADGRPESMHIEINIEFVTEEELDMVARFTMDYTFNAFGEDVVIRRPA